MRLRWLRTVLSVGRSVAPSERQGVGSERSGPLLRVFGARGGFWENLKKCLTVGLGAGRVTHMNRTRNILTTATLIGLAGGYLLAPTAHALMFTAAVRDGNNLYITETFNGSFDALPGDNLITVMSPVGDWQERARDFGCEPVVLFAGSENSLFAGTGCDF